MSDLSLPEKVVAIDVALDGAKIGHAFGGAIALAYYTEPRVTIDVDVNVFVPPEAHERVFAALEGLGVDRPDDAVRVERDGQSRWRWGRNPVDLFFANDPIHDAMRGAVRRVPFGESRIPILSPEHLVVCKALFGRAKDWIDIEQVLVTQRDLDRADVRRWLELALPSKDPRLTRFDGLAER